jgi:putative phosphoribosyl transferase
MRVLTGDDKALITIAAGCLKFEGLLTLPAAANGLILFLHGAGSGRLSPRNQFVAESLRKAGFASLLVDLLDEYESTDRRNVFCVELLADRLQAIVTWSKRHTELRHLPLGLFGASTGAAAAIVAAANLGRDVRAVVSRGGRPDLAGVALSHIDAPTLLIVRSRDEQVLQLNKWAFAEMHCEKKLEVIIGATHLFPEPGALEAVASLAGKWFREYLPRPKKFTAKLVKRPR